MEEKEKYEIDGEAFLMQMLDVAAEKLHAMGKLAGFMKELNDPSTVACLEPALKNVDKFSLNEQVEYFESLVQTLRVAKKLCEKYNINISKEW